MILVAQETFYRLIRWNTTRNGSAQRKKRFNEYHLSCSLFSPSRGFTIVYYIFNDFSCGSIRENSSVEALVDSLEEELNDISSSGHFANYLGFIETYKDTFLHPHHYLIMTATRNLIQYYTYRSPNEFLESSTLSNKFELCNILNMILGKIDPGYSEIRTFVQKELHFTRLLLCQKDLAESKIRKEEYLAKTRQSMTTLQDIDRQKQQLINFNCG